MLEPENKQGPGLIWSVSGQQSSVNMMVEIPVIYCQLQDIQMVTLVRCYITNYVTNYVSQVSHICQSYVIKPQPAYIYKPEHDVGANEAQSCKT